MPRRILFLLIAAALAAPAQKYDGPLPPKKDLPYLKHAANLVPTEDVVAKEENKKNSGSTYTIAGANSSAVTPLAAPVFLIQADKISPEKLSLYKLDSKAGHREIFITPKKQSTAIRIEVDKVSSSDNIWKIEVDVSLDPGEYCLTVDGDSSNQAFCFRVR
jgi:hypothetical protein